MQMRRELYADDLGEGELRRNEQRAALARSHVDEREGVRLQRERVENLVDERGGRRHVEVGPRRAVAPEEGRRRVRAEAGVEGFLALLDSGSDGLEQIEERPEQGAIE